jgi:dTDP-4-dehydrorhamnose 3,5-epimerase
MKVAPTSLHGAVLIEAERLADERGFFARTFCQETFSRWQLKSSFVQSSVSFNARRGTLRGMHFQNAPHGETKLVRCTRGAIHDVIVDLRRDSTSFMRWFGVELSAENHLALYVPEGFAHGFLTLCDESEVLYQMTDPFVAGAASGVRWNDPAFGIDWPNAPVVISDRDRAYPDFVA